MILNLNDISNSLRLFAATFAPDSDSQRFLVAVADAIEVETAHHRHCMSILRRIIDGTRNGLCWATDDCYDAISVAKELLPTETTK